jgi:hypothetical protein
MHLIGISITRETMATQQYRLKLIEIIYSAIPDQKHNMSVSFY